MAVQLHVAFSRTFAKGAGIVAGGPYYCAQNNVTRALGPCMMHNASTEVENLIAITKSWSLQGVIDNILNMRKTKVYLFSGKLDSLVHQAVMDDLATYYANFVPIKNIKYRNDIVAQHSIVTDNYGNPCDKLAVPFINNCSFDSIGEMLTFIYDDLKPRNSGPLTGKFLEFNQTKFVVNNNFAPTGFVYIPTTCGPRDSALTLCKLLVAIHGCMQSVAYVGLEFVMHAGYNNWADTNNIVVLYPQLTQNPENGCWDWWGYESPDYAKKSGP